jgi:hypothetical protein
MNETEKSTEPAGSNLKLYCAGTIIVVVLVVSVNYGMKQSTLQSNEQQAANACKAYAEAQEIFHRNDWDGDGILEYTPKISDLWETKPGTGNVALISAEFAAADATLPNPKPFKGYLFKPLLSRTVNGKTSSYLIAPGHQTLGYAIMAYPAKYKMTGVNTFTISNTGTIYQKDLGPDTASVAAKTETFDPPPINWGHHAE